MKKILLIVLNAVIFSGCMFTNDNDISIEGTWRLYDITPKDEEGVDFSTTANLKKKVQEGSVISFFENNTYTELDGPGNFKSGKWDLEKNAINLTDQNSITANGNITTEKKPDSKSFHSLQFERGELIIKYLKESPALVKYKNDPFYASNNQWRIKSSKPENTKDLYNKLAGYFKHLAFLLKAVNERKQQIVSFEFSQGPVKIYDGAIGIHPYEIVPQEWKNTFYNDSSALAAYSIFRDYLRTSNYKGAGTGDWIEDDYNILLSIYADFNKSDN